MSCVSIVEISTFPGGRLLTRITGNNRYTLMWSLETRHPHKHTHTETHDAAQPCIAGNSLSLFALCAAS